MSYVLRSKNREGRKIFKVFLWTLIIVLFFAGTGFFAPTFFSGLFIKIATPLWSLGNAVQNEASVNLGFFRSKEVLVLENKALKDALAETQIKLLAYDVLKQEHETLKDLLGRSTPQGFILAGVLVRPPQTPYDNIIVDVGFQGGVRVGDMVLASDSVILGTVLEVYERSAKVELFSTAGKKTQAFISRTSAPVELTGRGGGDFGVSIPREVSITPEDKFVIAGASGFLLAHIKTIDSKPTDSFQNVLAESPANMLGIRFVTIRRQ